MARQAHGRPMLTAGLSRPKKRKQPKGRGLNALERAEQEFPEHLKIRQHRLGYVDEEDNNARQDGNDRSSKRRKVDITEASSADEGSDLDGNTWHIGVEDEDDDSDLDSDEAFGDSDEEKFADFTFRGSGATKSSRDAKMMNSDEDEQPVDDFDAEHSDLGDEAIDLAAAWDLDEEEQRSTERKAHKKQKANQLTQSPLPAEGVNSSEESAASEEEEESEDDDGGDRNDMSMQDEVVDADTISRLSAFVNGLTPAENTEVETKPQRATLTLSDQPSQFGLGSAGITVAEMMRFVKDPVQKQSLKIVQAGEKDEGSHTKGGIPGKLAVPLARRQQDRLDRSAAYDQTKQTLDRWIDTVKQNRRAEHVSFPLIDPTKASASAVKSFQPISRAAPQTDLEAKIQEILVESGVSTSRSGDPEAQEREFEELQAKRLSIEEVQARQRELRMQRELMFREEIRAKRIKKIKSKAYQRVHRKERDKQTVREREQLHAAGLVDSDEERERNDRRRAEERMGARHRDSKWAKAAKATGQTTWNDDAKVAVSEMATRNEELRRRIQGKNERASSTSDESDSDDSNSDSEDNKWNAKLEKLDKPLVSTGQSKLADMAFMKRAEAQSRSENDAELRLLRRATAGNLAEADSDSDVSDNGRITYGGQNTARRVITNPVRNEFEEKLSDDESGGNEDQTDNRTEPLLQLSTKAVPRPPSRKASLSKTKPKTKGLTRKDEQIDKSGMSTVLSVPAESVLTEPVTESDNDPLDDKDELAMGIFAGDDEADLRKQFQQEKNQLVEEEGDQIIDNSLPGWGSWTGAGVSKRTQKNSKFITTVKGVAPESRKDAKLDRVIINEKRNKKNGKYLATELPHPFESRSQYERSLRLPMGPEWSTRNHFQDAIKPRVLLKQGHVIKPMARPSI